MLLRFTFENAFSFFEESTISLIATSDKRHPSHVSSSEKPGAPDVLRVAGIYGANGHGKTKLVDALLFMKRFVSGDTPDGFDTYFAPFKLNSGAAKAPSRFVVNFRTSRADYEYGVVIRNGEVDEEWLFEKEKRQEVMLFTRERSKGKNKDEVYQFEFGAKLRNSKPPSSKFSTEEYLQFIAAGVGPHVSFLNEAVDRRIRRLEDSADWFHNTLQIVKADSRYSSLHFEAAEDKKFLKYLSSSLRRLDTGIGQLRIKETEAPEEIIEKMPLVENPEVLERIKGMAADEGIMVGKSDGPSTVIQRKPGGYQFLEFVTVHNGDQGEVEFSLDDESSGTRRLLDLYPMLYNLIKGDRVYIVDELDRKLHPLLAYDFVKTFLKSSKGQLIFTTHTTHLLDLDLLRRDEVWLVQKKNNGSSELYPLNDFKIRPDLDVRKGYLQGRFGGIPFVGDAKALGWC